MSKKAQSACGCLAAAALLVAMSGCQPKPPTDSSSSSITAVTDSTSDVPGSSAESTMGTDEESSSISATTSKKQTTTASEAKKPSSPTTTTKTSAGPVTTKPQQQDYYPDYPEGKYDASSSAPLINDLYGKRLLNGWFSPTTAAVKTGASFKMTTNITQFDNSKWYPKWDEKDVFRLELKDENEKFALRIGKGGQIYSIETPIGEIMPPQNKEHAWIDDTTTITVQQYDQNMVEPDIGNLYQFTGFIHQAGMYQHKDPTVLGDKSFFSPIVAENYDSATNTYSAITLGMISSGPAYNRADVLIYSRLRNLGGGVIEADYMMYNYNTQMKMSEKEQYTADFSIWGGVRRSKLPNLIIELDDGSTFKSNASFGSGGLFDAPEFGSYHAATQDANSNSSYTFSWVNNNQKQNPGQSLFFNLGNANRDDYNVMSFTYRDKMKPGTAYRFKMYYVLGELGEVKAISHELSKNTPHGFVEFTEENTPTIPLFLRKENGQTVLADRGDSRTQKPALFVYAQPVKNSKPLYLIRNVKTGQYHVTTDPYMLMERVPIPGDKLGRLGYRPYDGTTEIIKLFGYVMPQSSANSKLSYAPLNSIVTDKTYFTQKGVYDSGIQVRTTSN